jgi:type VI secretion system FHA domain protein
MILTLEVTGPEPEKRASGPRTVFDEAGGTIGRLPDNRLVLADPYVSSRHAVIRCTNGVFYIEDTSTNGVCINSPENRLRPGEPYALHSGDRILIDPYEIRATVTTESKADPFAADAEVDPLRLLDLEGRPQQPQKGRTAEALARESVLAEHYQPPAPIPGASDPMTPSRGALIPDDYDPLVSDHRLATPPPPPTPSSPPTPRPVPAVPAPSAVDQPPAVRKSSPARLEERPASPDATRDMEDVSLSALLAGAGLDPGAVTPELARTFGQILRVVVSGVMDVLQARQQTKEEFHMGMTRFKPADNNPLKFSANVEDALHNLLVKRNPAYLGPVDAFEDAFDDLRNHQVATLAGVRVAFEAMLAQFDPDRLQDEFGRQLKKETLGALLARLRYWDLYRDRFRGMTRDEDATFRELFGDEFAKAYEDQLKRLKAQNRGRKS